MRMYDIIHKKRNGLSLTDEEIAFFIRGYTSGEIPDYQASALLMAIYFNGMNIDETVRLTSEMAHSGDMVDLSSINGITVDKHSTGGVGDKTTLIVAPIVAALGCKVAKMSGRGLGHTGGTVDKLESINGFKVELSPEDFFRQVNEIGLCVMGQTGNITPADKKLYALRDVTATVENTSLIASSIMSKKLAGGSSRIMLDVKCGSGAFMKTPDKAAELAKIMVGIGNSSGRKTAALITNMDIPLGYAVGNALEVTEAVDILKGRGCGDLTELCVMLSAYMLTLCNDEPVELNKEKVQAVIKNGEALEKFRQMITAQGGNADFIENPELLKTVEIEHKVLSTQSGYIRHMDAEKIGIASVILGAGREKKGDPIDYGAGILLKAKTGDYINAGDTVAVFYTSDQSRLTGAQDLFLSSLEFTPEKPEKPALIYDVIL